LLRRVQVVGHDFVQPEVANESEAVRGVDGGRVRVRLALALRIDARPFVLEESSGQPQPPVFADG
jgi:hypothetical protein